MLMTGVPAGVGPGVCVSGLPGVQVGLTAIVAHTTKGLCPQKITGLGGQKCWFGLGGQKCWCGIGGQSLRRGMAAQWTSHGLLCGQNIGGGAGGGGQKKWGHGGQKSRKRQGGRRERACDGG